MLSKEQASKVRTQTKRGHFQKIITLFKRESRLIRYEHSRSKGEGREHTTHKGNVRL